MRDEDFGTLIVRLDSQGREVMPEFYLRTSAHFYGVIHRIVRDDAQSSAAVQRLYGWIWSRRAMLARQPSQALTVVRAEAHRYALDARMQTQDRPDLASGVQDAAPGDPQEHPLQSAYLDCEMPGGRAVAASESDNERTARLLDLLRTLREGRS